MKKFFAVLALLVLTLSPAARAARVTVDRILANVNGDIITLSEFQKYKAMMLMGAPEQPLDVDADRQLLRQLIDKKLILQEAEKLDITVRDREIENAFEDVLQRNKIDERTLERELAKQDTTVDEYKKVLKGEILQSRIIGRAVHAKINITDEEMQAFYEQNMRGSQKTGPRVRIQQILLLIPEGAPASKIRDIEKNAQDLHKEIMAGEDFGKLAVKHSQGAGAQLGGDIGYFYRGELMADIEKVAFSLNKGEVSPVFRTEIGFHLLKVIDKIEGDAAKKTDTWQDHKKEIHNMLYGAQFEKEITKWMQGLKEKAYIEIN